LSEATEQTILSQTSPTRERSLDKIKRFKDSVVPRELLRIPFEMPRKEFEDRLCASIYYMPEGSPGSLRPFTGETVRIIDISIDNYVQIGWLLRSHGGEGSIQPSGDANGVFNDKQVAWLKQRWQELYEETCPDADEAAIEEAGLDDSSVRKKRAFVLKSEGLDDATIAGKRTAALRKAQLDDASVETARELIRQQRAENKSSPPASRSS